MVFVADFATLELNATSEQSAPLDGAECDFGRSRVRLLSRVRLRMEQIEN